MNKNNYLEEANKKNVKRLLKINAKILLCGFNRAKCLQNSQIVYTNIIINKNKVTLNLCTNDVIEINKIQIIKKYRKMEKKCFFENYIWKKHIYHCYHLTTYYHGYIINPKCNCSKNCIVEIDNFENNFKKYLNFEFKF